MPVANHRRKMAKMWSISCHWIQKKQMKLCEETRIYFHLQSQFCCKSKECFWAEQVYIYKYPCFRPKCRNELLPLSRQYEWCHFSINFVSREISFEINWSLGNFAFAFACGTAYQSRKRFERKKKLLKSILLKECRKIIKSVKLISDL